LDGDLAIIFSAIRRMKTNPNDIHKAICLHANIERLKRRRLMVYSLYNILKGKR
jgi:hypothetical protein